MPLALAALAAMIIDTTQSSCRVPILSTRASARPVISSTSAWQWAITGEAPVASRILAEAFMTT